MNAASGVFDGSNKYIRITDIDEESRCYTDENPVSPKGELDDKYLVRENDILFARTGASTGKTYLYKKSDGKLYFAGFLIRISVNCDNNSIFVYNATLTDRYNRWVRLTSMRSGQPGINSQEYSSYKTYYPLLAEQNKIASFLKKLDKRIEKQRKLVELLKSYKRGFLNSYISQNEPSWEKMRLSDILSERKEYCEKDGTYSHATLSKDGVYGKSDRYDRDYLVSSDDKKYKVTHMGDLCYNPANLKFGVICINTYGDAIFSPIYVTFEISEQHITEFVGAYLMRPDFINQALRFQEGTVYERMAVSPDDLLAMSIHLPPKSEQDKLAKGLSKMQMKIQAEEDVLNKTVLLKKALLSLLFI